MIAGLCLSLLVLTASFTDAVSVPVTKRGDHPALYKASGKVNLDDFVGISAPKVYPLTSLVFAATKWNSSFVQSGITNINETSTSFRIFLPDLTEITLTPAFSDYDDYKNIDIELWWIWGYAMAGSAQLALEGIFADATADLYGCALRMISGRQSHTVVPANQDELWNLLVKSHKQPVVVIVKKNATGGLTPKAALPVVFTRNDNGHKAAALWDIKKGMNILASPEQIFNDMDTVATFEKDVA